MAGLIGLALECGRDERLSVKRLVIVGTMRRGALDPREELPGDVETAILEREYSEACLGNSVVWATSPGRKLPPRAYHGRSKKLERMMELAGRVG